jgi:hypothetical protein
MKKKAATHFYYSSFLSPALYLIMMGIKIKIKISRFLYMEKFQEKKIEYLKWENDQLRSMIKDYAITTDFKYSNIINENHCEINHLKRENEKLLSLYSDCKTYLKPQIFPRNYPIKNI